MCSGHSLRQDSILRLLYSVRSYPGYFHLGWGSDAQYRFPTRGTSSGGIPQPSSSTAHEFRRKLTWILMWRGLASREFWTSSETACVRVVMVSVDRSRAVTEGGKDTIRRGAPVGGDAVGHSITGWCLFSFFFLPYLHCTMCGRSRIIFAA